MMRFIRNYSKFRESLVIDLNIFRGDIFESMNIWHDVLLNSIAAKEEDLIQVFNLPIEFTNKSKNLENLSDNIEFINSLSSIGLKKSQVQNTDDFSTFVNKPCKFMFVYNIESNELENPVYIVFQVWNSTLNKWEDLKLYKINDDVKKFYDKLTSKTIEINDGEINYIYQTSNGNDWELQNLDSANETFKRFLRKDELQKILDDRKVKISII